MDYWIAAVGGPDEDWFGRFRNGSDRVAKKEFKKVFDLLYRPIQYYSQRIVNNDAEAEDIVMRCLTKVWEQRGNFESPSHLYRWLIRVTRNESISFLRYRNVEATIIKELGSAEEERVDLELLRTSIMERVLAAMSKLSPKAQDCLRLKFFEGKTTREIAHILKTTEGNVYTIHCRAFQDLRRLLGDDWRLLIFLYLFKEIF